MPDVFVAKKRIKELTPKVHFEKQESKRAGELVSPLAAFVFHPKNLRVETQEKDEKIVLFLRRHIITNLSWLILVLVLVIIPIFAFGLFSFETIPPAYRLMGVIFWYLLTFAFGLERFISWFFNVNIITDERIIDVNFPSILYKDISETKIDRVQDVTCKTGGFIRNFLNYGDVLIQTAGALPEICFEAVPYPSRVAEVLNELILEEEQEKLEGRVK